VFHHNLDRATDLAETTLGGARSLRGHDGSDASRRQGRAMTEDFYCEEALSGRTHVEVVLETDDVLAFHHTRPYWPVHIVVVPKRHVPSLIDLGDADETLLHHVLAVVRRVAAQVTREHGACRVLTNLGRYQDSKHLHFHVNAGEPVR
jgi:histidine triad (HIT) family protein